MKHKSSMEIDRQQMLFNTFLVVIFVISLGVRVMPLRNLVFLQLSAMHSHTKYFVVAAVLSIFMINQVYLCKIRDMTVGNVLWENCSLVEYFFASSGENCINFIAFLRLRILYCFCLTLFSAQWRNYFSTRLFSNHKKFLFRRIEILLFTLLLNVTSCFRFVCYSRWF